MSSRSPWERKFVGYISGKKILENRLNDELMWCLVEFHTICIANTFPKVKKAHLEIHPLSQKKKSFTSASTRTELHKTNITVESPSE